MTEETEAFKEAAKATQEIAKTSSKAINTLSLAGKFLYRIIGQPVEDSLGLINDQIRYFRASISIKLEASLNKKLKDKGIKETRNVPLKLATSFFEKATLEENETLQDKWVNLLLNAMNPNYLEKINRSFITILSELEPIDARILDELYKERNKPKNVLFDKSKIAKTISITIEDCDISLRNLMRLVCIKPGIVTGGLAINGHLPSTYKDTELFDITSLGLAFVKSIQE